jgi:circadian clock protein KaiC
MNDRVKTGVVGLDEQIEGGFPRGRTILVAGACATGKSLFGLKYIYEGAAKYNEPGVYLSLDETISKIRKDALCLGMSFDKLEAEKKMKFIDRVTVKQQRQLGEPTLKYGEKSEELKLLDISPGKTHEKFFQVCDEINAKRGVIDSAASLLAYLPNEESRRSYLSSIAQTAEEKGITLILISEVPEQAGPGASIFSRYGVEEYISDGVILLKLYSAEASERKPRKLSIRKMRETVHSYCEIPFTITNKGIELEIGI